MSGLIIQLPGTTFTGTGLPKLYRDAIINSGSMFCFDFLDTYCNPNPVGNLANGLTFTNLVTAGPVATVVNTGTSNVAMASNGVVFNGSGFGAIDFGTTYDLSGSNNSFLATAWFKTSSSQNAAYPGVMGLAGNTGSTNQYSIDSGPNPGTTATLAHVGVGSTTYSGTPPTTLQQVAVFWTPGSMTMFRNGVVVTSAGAPTTLVATGIGHEGLGVSASILNAFSPFNGTVYRAWKENITNSATASGLTQLAQATAQIAADYAANSGRFS